MFGKDGLLMDDLNILGQEVASFFNTLLDATLKSIGEECGKAKLIALSSEGNRFYWADGAWK